MKRLGLGVLLAVLCSTAQAQFSVIEKDGDNSLRLLGSIWRPSFFSLASVEADKVANEGGRLSTYNFLTLATQTENFRLAVRFPFLYNTADPAGTDRFSKGRQNAQEVVMQDFIIGLQNGNFWLLPWDIGTFWEGRVYLPTSKFSRDTGQIARLRNDLIFSKLLSRQFGIEYNQKFSWYFQSRTAYPLRFEDENGFYRDGVGLTKRSELDHWLAAWFSFGPELSLAWVAGAEDTFWNRSPANSRSKPTQHILKTGPQVRFPMGRATNFIVSFEDKIDADSQKAEWGRFLAKNTTLSLLSFFRF